MSAFKPVYASPETSAKLSGNSTSPTSLNLSSTDNSREVTCSPPLPKKQYEDETSTTHLQQLHMKLQEEKVGLGQKRMREEEECDSIKVEFKKLCGFFMESTDRHVASYNSDSSDESDEDEEDEVEFNDYDQKQQELKDRATEERGLRHDLANGDEEMEGYAD